MDKISILCEGIQVGCQIYIFVGDAQLFPDMIAVRINRTGGYIHGFGNFFCRFTLFDHIHYLDFSRREFNEFIG